MAEAFAVIGFAANIAQLAGYCIRLISEAQEVYDSAATEENIELAEVIRVVKTLSQEIAEPAPQSSSQAKSLSTDNEVRELANSSIELSNQLLEILDDLRIRDDARFRKLESLRQAIRGTRKKRAIETLEKRLRRIQDAASQRMLKNLRNVVRIQYILLLTL